jgi:hypothetical protein
MNPGEVWQCPEVKSKKIAVKDFSVNMDVLAPGD